ncbi:unnamed protein product [Durusdinium trenchii]|uniref:Uncharacterized protein n=1 Tax=Durusdinium trenchii TaxID=1381693 RepID=A0ABP0PCW2_9DINO
MTMIAHSARVFVLVTLLSLGSAQEPNITRCTTGASNISQKAFHVQVCNLFGATCYMNHPDIQDCATEAIAIPSGECKMYPILEYQDNWVRSGSAAVEELSTESDLGCSIFIQNGDARFSGACAAVQCALDSGYAAPGMSAASGNSRDIGVTDTATAGWQTWSLVEIPDESEQLKTVFLYRTGNYIATLKRTYTWSTGGVTVSVGSLPTSNGNNYGPVACPGSNLVLTSTEATAISPLDLKVCGSTGKWVYWNAINLLVDQSLYAKFTDDATATSGSTRNIGAVPFLDGRSSFRSGEAAMDDPRAVMVNQDSTATSAVLMTSGTITPTMAYGAASGEVAGTWRSFGVVFYCDDYARTDLTTCASANQKMFYVADPNPEEQFGSTADLGGLGSSQGTSGSIHCTSPVALVSLCFLISSIFEALL